MVLTSDSLYRAFSFLLPPNMDDFLATGLLFSVADPELTTELELEVAAPYGIEGGAGAEKDCCGTICG